MTVYRALTVAIGRALRGSAARDGMDVLAREEANVRAAVRCAVETDQVEVAAQMSETFRDYLERSACFWERDQWLGWLANAVAHTTFSAAVAGVELNRAWSLFTQGHTAEAVQMHNTLIERLHQTTAFDATFELALAQAQLGRIFYTDGSAEQGISILTQAVVAWERLVRQAANLPQSETVEDLLTRGTEEVKQQREGCTNELNNLAVTLGDLANALMVAGHLDKGLSMAEQSIEISRTLGNDRNIVARLGQIAQILMGQGHDQWADAYYDQALEAARRLGDQALEGSLLQHQGRLADYMHRYDRAVDLYKQALNLFQTANNDASLMRTCNLLGVAEVHAGRLSEARVWYERSREIAWHRGNTRALGIAAQNIGIVCQNEASAARQLGDEATARQQFAEAERFLQENLRITIDLQDKPGEASSRSQLAQVYLLMGELVTAEAHAHKAREIDEGLGIIRQLPRDYYHLAQIAHARGDGAQAAQWETKRDEVEAELARRARGGGAPDAGLSQ